MILGYDYFFGLNETSLFQTTFSVGNINQMIIQKGVFDEINIDENISKIYNNVKEEWDYQTVALAKFQNNLEAGNINNAGIPIDQIKFQKRETDSLVWQDVAILDYSILQTVYTVLDKYVKSNFEYDYAVVPLTSNITGKRTTQSITPEFESVFLCDKDTSFQLMINLEVGSFEHVNPSSILEPLNAKYPIISYSVLDYKKGSIKALILSSDTMSQGNINVKSEKANRDNLLKFLKNHKPKIFKTSSGEFMIISIIDNPKEIPNNNLGQAIAEVSFSFVEIDDSERENALIENGLVVL